jgi:uncharacterized protein involved in exopolysaccharide biosynthesis
MFEWFKNTDLEADVLGDNTAASHIQELWKNHTRLALAVSQMSELMKNLATAQAQLREDLDFIVAQTVRLSDQHNKLAALIAEDEFFHTNTHSTSVH